MDHHPPRDYVYTKSEDAGELDPPPAQPFWRCIKIGFVFMMAFWAIFMITSVVYAHDALPTATQPLGWRYGYECCSALDCSQSGPADIKETKAGYVVVKTGEVIPYGDKKRIKQSKDEFFHRCSVGGKPDARTLCVYVPDRGF